MKEITHETIQRIFALHIGCEVMAPDPGEDDGSLRKAYITGIHGEYQLELQFIDDNGNVSEEPAYCQFSEATILVKHLSSVTDEDLEAISFNFPDGTKGIEFDFQFDNYKFHWKAKRGLYIKEGFLTLKDFDYLRSKGYALPAHGYSVDELMQAGIFMLKQ